MRKFLSRLGWRIGLLAVVALAVATGIAYATIPDSSGVYTACKLNATGTIRLIDPSLPSTNLLGHCTSYETQITWSQAGPRGAQGVQGPKGDTGNTGATGSAGPQGSQGAKGDTGAAGPQGVPGDAGPAGKDGASCVNSDGTLASAACQGPKGDPGSQGPTGPAGPQGPAGPAGGAPTLTSFVTSQGFTAVSDGSWHAMPGVALTFTLNSSSTVQLEFGFSTLVGGGYVITRIDVDGAPAAGTARVIGMVSYASTEAEAFVSLAAGAHTITAEYKTATSFNFDPVDFDWQTASLQALAFDH